MYFGRIVCDYYLIAMALLARISEQMAVISSTIAAHGVSVPCVVVPLSMQPMNPPLSRQSGIVGKQVIPPENDLAIYAIGAAAWHDWAAESIVSRASQDSLPVLANIGECWILISIR